MLMSLAFLLALVAMALLSAAMNKHHRQVWGRRPSAALKLVLRVCAAASSALSLVCCAGIYGWSVGAVLWFGLLNLAAILVAMFFTYWPLSPSR